MDAQPISVLLVRNPFDPARSAEHQTLEYHPSWCLAEYLTILAPAAEYVVSVNGGPVKVESRAETFLEPGDQLVVCPLVEGGGGGGGGKMAARIVGLIVVAILTWYVSYVTVPAILAEFGVEAGSAGMIAAQATTAAIMSVGGSMLVGALTQPQAPKSPDISGAGDTSSAYAWDGPRLLAMQGIPIGVLYGTHRMSGNLISRRVTMVAGGTAEDQQYLDILIALCEGPVASISEIEINGDAIDLYAGMTVETRLGTLDQTVIPAFNDIAEEDAFSVKVTPNLSIVRDTTGTAIDAIEVDIEWPLGLYGTTAKGEVIGWGSSYEIHYKPYGTPDTAYQPFPGSPFTDISAHRSPKRKTLRVDNLTPGHYTVRIHETTVDHGDNQRFFNDLYWVGLREITYDDLAYPGMALLGIRALATNQLSGAQPNVTCLVTRGTVPVWDGSQWLDKASDNPAWVAYDLLVNDRYGGGEPTSRVDYPSFAAWAAWCDELVDDGNGGTEKRCRFDGVFDTEDSLWGALVKVASTARGAVLIRGTKYFAQFDAPATPVQLFSVGNIVADSFREIYLPLQDRATEIEVQFSNEAHAYARDVLSVMNDEGYDGSGVSRKSTVSLIGVTRKTQAFREARYRMLLNMYLKKTVQFDADIDAIACEPGDLIYLQHDAPKWGDGGRLVSATANTLTLDKDIILQNGHTYRAMVRLGNDTLVEKSILVSGDYAGPTITLASAFGSVPNPLDVYLFGETNKDRKVFRVLSVKRAKELTLTLNCVEYNEAVYTDDTLPPLPPPAPMEPPLPVDIPDPVTDLAVKQRWPIASDGSVSLAVDVTWRAPAESTPDLLYRVYLSDTGGVSWTELGATRNTWYTLTGLSESTAYRVAVVCETPAGVRNALYLAPYVSFTVTANPTIPAVPTSIGTLAGIDTLVLTWTPPADPDFAAVEVWRSATNDSNTATQVGEGTGISFLDRPPPPYPCTYYYWFRSRNTVGNVSAFDRTQYNGHSATAVGVGPTHIQTDTAVITVAAQIANAIIQNAHIVTMTADKLTAATIQAALKIGTGAYTYIDGPNSRFTVSDSNSTTRILLGKIGTLATDYGLNIYDAGGVLMYSFSTGAQTAGIVDNAVTDLAQTSNTSYNEHTLTTSWNYWDELSVSYTVVTGPVLVLAFVKIYAQNDLPDDWTVDYSIAIRRDTTDLHTRDGNMQLLNTGGYEWHNVGLGIINDPGPGSYTWKIRVGAKGGYTSSSLWMRSWNMYLQVIELKK